MCVADPYLTANGRLLQNLVHNFRTPLTATPLSRFIFKFVRKLCCLSLPHCRFPPVCLTNRYLLPGGDLHCAKDEGGLSPARRGGRAGCLTRRRTAEPKVNPECKCVHSTPTS